LPADFIALKKLSSEWAYLVIFLAQVDEDLAGEKLSIGPDISTDRRVIKEYNYGLNKTG